MRNKPAKTQETSVPSSRSDDWLDGRMIPDQSPANTTVLGKLEGAINTEADKLLESIGLVDTRKFLEISGTLHGTDDTVYGSSIGYRNNSKKYKAVDLAKGSRSTSEFDRTLSLLMAVVDKRVKFAATGIVPKGFEYWK